MENDNRKQQHIVPKFYLEKFCDKSGHFSVYEHIHRRFFPSSPRKFCKEGYVYETKWENANPMLGQYVLPYSIEKAFSEKEIQFSQLLNDTLKRCSDVNCKRQLICNTEEKQLLAEFVVNLYLRNPLVFQHIIQEDYPIEELRSLEICKQTDALFKSLKLGCPDALIKHSVKQGMFDTSIDGSPAAFTLNQLTNLHPIFLRSNGANFITSSRPVIWIDVRNNMGQDIGSEVSVPLSPNILLIYTGDPKCRSMRNRLFDLEESIQ